jgi:C4-dicarboxylate-specific signal transduction histidine kinase
MRDRAASGRRCARSRPSLAGALLAAALAATSPLRAAPADPASPTSVPDKGGPPANGDQRNLSGALAIAAAIEAGVIVLLLVAMRRRRRADAAACRDLVEIAHLTRAAATREVGRLLAREIGTPLTSALNNLAAARRLLLREPPQLQEISAAVDEAQAAGESVARVLQRLHGLLPARTRPDDLVDLNDVVREGVRLVTGVRAGAIVADISPLPGIRGDRIELLQVVLELLLNAVEKASAAGRASVVIRTRTEGEAAELSVEHDSGASVFEPDHPGLLAPSLATEAPALGTGLAIARSIVESYGGQMSAEPSSLGARLVSRRGVTMRVRFERATGVA